MSESLSRAHSMRGRRGRPDVVFRRVFHRAALQHGIITVTDAAGVGVPAATLRSFAHRDALVRVSQGVYRLRSASLDGLTLLMATCRWACTDGWALTGSAALWWLCDGATDDRWRDVCPTVTVRVPSQYQTRRQRPAMLTLRYDLANDTPVLWERGFAVGPLDEALTHCADELARMACYGAYGREIALGCLTRWSGELFLRDVVTRADILNARARLLDAFDAAAGVARRCPSRGGRRTGSLGHE